MQNSLEIKKALLEECYQFCNVRLEGIQHQIKEIQIALTTETKSSAGDKHETARAMLQLEREKLGNQLAEIQKLQQVLSKIDNKKNHLNISLGSIVYTTQANYFIAISAGELLINSQMFYAISANTPIGEVLLGKKALDEVVFRGQKFCVKSIF